MMKKRMNNRIAVDLPVTCSIEQPGNREQQTQGRVLDLSISGIQMDLPLSPAQVGNTVMDFVLDLPSPFKKIKGAGEIQWKRWNQDSQSTTCGIKLMPMHLEQLQALDIIIEEVRAEATSPAGGSKTK